MLVQILAVIKALAEILGIAKFFYKEIAPTPEQAATKIDTENQTQEEKAKTEGRPTP